MNGDGTSLVSGAGVAGPALVYWLQRFGFEATLVERASSIRPGGQAIDVRGVAVEILKDMGLYDASSARRTHMRGASALDADGNEVWRSEERSFSGGRLDSGDIELFETIWCDCCTRQRRTRASICGTTPLPLSHRRPAAFGCHSNKNGRVSLISWWERTACIRTFGGYHSRTRLQCLQSFGIGLAIYTAPNLLNLQDWQVSHRDADMAMSSIRTLITATARESGLCAVDAERLAWRHFPLRRHWSRTLRAYALANSTADRSHVEVNGLLFRGYRRSRCRGGQTGG